MNRKSQNIGAAVSAGLAGAVAFRAAVRWSRRFSFAGKTVLVTGGSRGLGLVIARKLVDAAARVAICARTRSQVEAAGHELRRRAAKVAGADVLAYECDVGNRQHVDEMVSDIREHWGPIDVLINVAGMIEVGPLESMTLGDFHEAMAVNCWGALHTISAVLPDMRKRRWGRIVNIASIGGKIAVPHLLPYDVSKFALVGLSTGLRTELAKDGILVTTVCPGLMRTGSPRNAIFKGQHRKEYAWFAIGDAMPGIAISAERAASQTLRACQQGKSEVVLSLSAKFGAKLRELAPNFTAELLSLVNRMLPAIGGIREHRARGYQSESTWAPSLLTALGDRAAVANNEID